MDQATLLGDAQARAIRCRPSFASMKLLGRYQASQAARRGSASWSTPRGCSNKDVERAKACAAKAALPSSLQRPLQSLPRSV